MLYYEPVFLYVFLPLAVITYYLLNKVNLRAGIYGLVVFSFVFYASASLTFLVVLAISMLFNFFYGKLLFKHRSKKLLYFGVLCNLGSFIVFKYTDFILTQLNYISNINLPLAHIILPLGISFFTFQQIAYLFDVANGLLEVEYKFIDYALFVSFFPQLVTGPIVHHAEMLPQFESTENKSVNWDNIYQGLIIFGVGLFKKLIIADNIAVYIDDGYSHIDKLSFVDGWGLAFGYLLQLYFDFSGYMDMAVGLGLLFNIRLPLNFNSPLKSRNIIEFWRLWHITLGRFFHAYLYVPLKDKRGGVVLGAFAVFLLGGFWHGANWTFLVWGLCNGVGYIFVRYLMYKEVKFNEWFAWAFTFVYMSLIFVFFRSSSVSQAFSVFHVIFINSVHGVDNLARFMLAFVGYHIDNADINVYFAGKFYFILFGLTLWVKFLPNTFEITRYIESSSSFNIVDSKLLYLVVGAICFVVPMMRFFYGGVESPFIYWNF